MTINQFQERYRLRNREMADICSCSLPTIQKWRSGEISMSGTARQLLTLLDAEANGDAEALRRMVDRSKAPRTGDFGPQSSGDLPVKRTRRGREGDPLALMLTNQRLQRSLVESEQRYLQIMDALPDPVCRWEKDTRIVYANPAYRKLYQVEGDIIGQKWIEFVPEAERYEIMTLVNEFVRRGGVQKSEHLSRDRHGRITYYEWMDLPIYSDSGELFQYHSIGWDRTKERSLGGEAQALQKAVNILFRESVYGYMLLDQDGRILQCNDKVAARKDSPKNLTDLIGGKLPVRFSRLLAQLSVDGQMRYRFNRDGADLVLVMTLLYKDSERMRYLGEVLPVEASETFQVQPDGVAERVPVAPKRAIAEKPVASPELTSELAAIVQRVGERMKVDRCSLVCEVERTDTYEVVVSWNSPELLGSGVGIERSNPTKLKWLSSRVDRGMAIKLDGLNRLPSTAKNELELFSSEKIGGLVILPVALNIGCRIFLMAEQLNQSRLWHDQDMDEFKHYRELIEQAIARYIPAKRKR